METVKPVDALLSMKERVQMDIAQLRTALEDVTDSYERAVMYRRLAAEYEALGTLERYIKEIDDGSNS